MAKTEKATKEKVGLKVLPGGKGPDGPVSTNWLKELPKGAIFNACLARHSGPELRTFQILFRHKKSAVLGETLTSGEQVITHYDYERFSRDYVFHELLMVFEETETDHGEHDSHDGIQDERDRPHQSG